MMGVWFLGSSLGKLMAGLIAGGFDPTNLAGDARPLLEYRAVSPAASASVLLLLSRPITRLMGGVDSRIRVASIAPAFPPFRSHAVFP